MHKDLAPQPHQTATALPAHYYTDAAMAAVDRRAILDRSWQLLAHVSQLRETGDHIVADLGGLPVIAPGRSRNATACARNRCVAATTAGTTGWMACSSPPRK